MIVVLGVRSGIYAIRVYKKEKTKEERRKIIITSKTKTAQSGVSIEIQRTVSYASTVNFLALGVQPTGIVAALSVAARPSSRHMGASPVPSPLAPLKLPPRRRLDRLSTATRPVPFTAKLLRRTQFTSAASASLLEPLVPVPGALLLPPVMDPTGPPLGSPPPSPTLGVDQSLVASSLRCSSSLPSMAPSLARPELRLERRGARWWRADPGLFQPTHTMYGHPNRPIPEAVRGVDARFLEHAPTLEETLKAARVRRVKTRKARSKGVRMGMQDLDDGDGLLDFDEFAKLLPAQLTHNPYKEGTDSKGKPLAPKLPMPTLEMMRDWFYLCDSDHDGQISFTAFFAFSMREVLARAHRWQSLNEFFGLWDNVDQMALDVDIFIQCCREFGMEPLALDLLTLCDRNSVGGIEFEEICRVFRLRTCGSGPTQERYIRQASKAAIHAVNQWHHTRALAKSREMAEKDMKEAISSGTTRLPLIVDVNGNRSHSGSPSPQPLHKELRPPDAATALALAAAFGKVDTNLRKSQLYDPQDPAMLEREDVGPALRILRMWLRQAGFTAIDTFTAWDDNNSFTLTRAELQRGFTRDLGLVVDDDLIILIFDHLSSSYHLTYDEWKTWFNEAHLSGDDDELDDDVRREKAAVTVQQAVRRLISRRGAEKRRVARRAERKAAKAAAKAAAKEATKGATADGAGDAGRADSGPASPVGVEAVGIA